LRGQTPSTSSKTHSPSSSDNYNLFHNFFFMRYTSVREVRLYNGWHPIEARRQQLARAGANIFKTPHRPLVDADWDGTIIDDVKIYLDGEPVEPSAIDPDEGVVELVPPPADGVRVEADYSWHPVGDGEIENAVEAAEAEVEALTGAVYTPHTRVERVRVFRGRHITLSEPVISVQGVKVFDTSGNLLDASAEAEAVDPSTGLIRLKHRSAEPGPPWYLPPIYEVEVSYVAGYHEVPPSVRQAVLTLASYLVLSRFQRGVSFTQDYGAVVAGFTADELGERLAFLQSEAERVRQLLPRRVSRA